MSGPGILRAHVPPVARLRSLVREGRSDAPGRLVDVFGRIGLAGYGVVHLLVAWLALEIAFGVPEAPADADGAVGTIARTPGGLIALGLAAVGLFAFALWQVSAAADGFGWVHGAERLRKRVGAVSKAIAMSALAIVVADYLLDVGSTGGTTAQSVAAGVLAPPAGRSCWGSAAARSW
ncbi:MAG: hypothetical protein JWR58_5630 [Pseudonocardia sp.]|nr:hypothetical protein [Pseudonocardia sp.]